VAPVQDRGFPMTQDAQERGFLMIEQVQRVIDQLQDDLDLIGMIGSPTDNPDEIWVGPSGPELIEIDEIVGLDNPEITMPQAGSPGDVSAQPKIVGTSGRTSAPNPLRELINIYDDEESLEVSLVTPVQITEEKEPEKASSPAPDTQIWSPSQNDQEVKSVLDTELLDAPETQKDSLKDEPGSGEQKEEAPQQEIDISTVDYQVSIEPTLDASISTGTQPPDEKKTEVGPSEHMEEVQEPSLEQIYTIGSLGNMLTWGDQQILEPVDEVADIHAIAYDWKRKFIMQRTTKKRRITLDHSILITTEEK
jgi:hypothetical protein